MKNKRPLFEIPEQLNKVLTDSGLLCSKPLVFAEADMDVSCEFRPHILLLTEKTLIHGKSKNLGMSGGKKQKPDYSEFTFEKYPIETLSAPAIDGFVVGGALRISVDGEQRSVCAFTNTYKGRISRLKEILSTLIKGDAPSAECAIPTADVRYAPNVWTSVRYSSDLPPALSPLNGISWQ